MAQADTQGFRQLQCPGRTKSSCNGLVLLQMKEAFCRLEENAVIFFLGVRILLLEDSCLLALSWTRTTYRITPALAACFPVTSLLRQTWRCLLPAIDSSSRWGGKDKYDPLTPD